MTLFDLNYLALVNKVAATGYRVDRRNGATLERLNLTLTAYKLPLLTVRKINTRAVVDEFIWEYNGGSNIYELYAARGWWEPFADELGEVPNAYGLYIREQLDRLLEGLINDPYGRRHRLCIDSPETEGFIACQPYKTFIVAEERLHMTVMSRSSDCLLGLPNDMLKDWLYMATLAQHANLSVGHLTYNIQSAHIYLNQLEALRALNEAASSWREPVLLLNPEMDEAEPTHADYSFENYCPSPALKIPFNH